VHSHCNNVVVWNETFLTQYTLFVTLASFLWKSYFFSDQISALSKSCYSHIRQLCCIHPHLDLKTASTIATFIVHSKLDYCNSLYYNLPEYQQNRLQLIQNSLARAVVRAPKSSRITPSLQSLCLHWLKIEEQIDYKILSLTYKVLTTTERSYLYDLISLQPLRSIRSSDVVTLSRPPSYSSLKVNNLSFRHASPRLWNKLPIELCQPVDDESLSLSSHLSLTGSSSSSSSSSPLSLRIIPSLFHSRLKTYRYLFYKSILPVSLTFSDGSQGFLWPFPNLIALSFPFVLLVNTFLFDSCDRLSLFYQLLNCMLNPCTFLPFLSFFVWYV